MKKVLFFCMLFALVSCDSKETKLNKAKEVVSIFASNSTFGNLEKLPLYYPNLKELKGRFLVLKDFQILNAVLNEKTISIIGKAQGNEVLFEVEKENGKYIITKTKGLSMFVYSNLYKYCKQIGCMKGDNYDVEISKICSEKEFQFYSLVEIIKREIEQNVRLENHTVQGGYGYVTGSITYKNYSKFTIPRDTYNLYVEYLNSKGKILFKEKTVEFATLTYGESNTTWVSKDIQGASKIAVSLEITNTDFIEKILAEHAKGNDCTYSNNL